MYEETNKKKLYVVLLLATAIISALVWIPVGLLYNLLAETVNRPLAIGTAFVLVMMTTAFVTFLLSNLAGAFSNDILTGRIKRSKIPLYIVGFAVCGVLLGMGLELVYEIDFKQTQPQYEGYIFVVDDSGSTTGTDAEGERFAAITALLNEKEDTYPYMVYRFADDVHVVQGMSTVGEGVPEMSGNSAGMTSIRAALTTALEDYKNGVWTANTTPTVILITDGYASDIGVIFNRINPVLSKYAKEGIAISTVGFGAADTSLLTNIADRTGGVYVGIQDASELDQAVQQATGTAEDSRTLLSNRSHRGVDWIYALMRILFVVALGMGVCFVNLVAYGRNDQNRFVFGWGFAKSLAAALVLEIGICGLGLPPVIADWIAMVLIGTFVARVPIIAQHDTGSSDAELYKRQYQDYDDEQFRY